MRAVCSVVCSDPSLSFYLTQQVPVQELSHYHTQSFGHYVSASFIAH